jgi:uncharacterized membrane protein YadS
MDEIEKNNSSWKSKTLTVGALIGALTGLGVAYFLIQNAEKEGEEFTFSSGQGLKLGLLLLGTMRQIMQLDDSGSKGKKR